jgi:nucleoside-diphosphate-sugar epimerase
MPVRWLQLDHGSNNAGSLLEREAVGAYAIVHCAALSSPWGKKEEFYRANIASTKEVLAACKAVNISRLVHISTPSLYFNFQDRLGIREDQILPNPVNEYARSKAFAEQLVHMSPIEKKVVLRPRAIFGPWDAALMPRLLRVMEKGFVPLMRGGKIKLDITYVDNVVEAVWLSLNHQLPRQQCTYNVTNNEPLELDSLLQQIARAFELQIRTRKLPWPLVDGVARLLESTARFTQGSEPLLTRYSAGVLAFSQTLNTDLIFNELGYVPKITIQEGIFRYAEWWKSESSSLRSGAF